MRTLLRAARPLHGVAEISEDKDSQNRVSAFFDAMLTRARTPRPYALV
jgi:hypothetical protein